MVQVAIAVMCWIGALASVYSLRKVELDRRYALAAGINGNYARDAGQNIVDQWFGMVTVGSLTIIFTWVMLDPTARNPDPSVGMIGRGIAFLVVVLSVVGRSMYAAWRHHSYVAEAVAVKQAGAQ